MIAIRGEKNAAGLRRPRRARSPRSRPTAQKWLKEQSIKLVGQAGARPSRRPRDVAALARGASAASSTSAPRPAARRSPPGAPLPAADRGAPPHRLPLHAALAHRADRPPRAGAGLRAARRRRDAGGRCWSSRSAIRPWARAPSWSRPAAQLGDAAGAGLGHAQAEKPDDPARRGRGRCTPAGSSRSAASTASTRTRWRSISPGCRSGSRRSRATTSSPSSTTR